MQYRERNVLRGLCAGAIMCAGSAAVAADLTWTGDTNNHWSTLPSELNWTTAWTNNVPRSSPNKAIFSLPTPATIEVTDNIDVGGIRFSTGGWNLNSGGGVLSTGGYGIMSIQTDRGTDTINAVIADGSTFGTGGGKTTVNKTGQGTLILGGVNTYTRPTIVSAGTLQFGVADAITTSVLAPYGGATAASAGRVDLHGFQQTVPGISSGFSSGPVHGVITNDLAGSTATLVLTGSGSGSFDGDLKDGAGTLALTLAGNQLLTLRGQNAYTGPTTVKNLGLLAVGNSTSLLGTLITVESNSTLQVSRPAGSNAANSSVSPDSVTLKGGALSLAADISPVGFLSNDTTDGVLYIDMGGATSYTAGGSYVLDFGSLPGTLRMGTRVGGIIAAGVVLIPDATATLRFGGGVGVGQVKVDATIADIGATATHVDVGIQGGATFTASNTYTGATTVSGNAILTVTNSNGLGSTSSGTTVSGNGRLNIDAAIAEPITVNGGTVRLNVAGTGTGSITLNGGVLCGHGAMAGPVVAGSAPHTLAPGVTFPPGSTGVLTLGALTTNADTTLRFNLVTPGASSVNDRIKVTGINALVLAGGTIEVAGSGPVALGYYRIFEYAGTTPSLASLVLPPPQTKTVYTLDAVHDPGFINLHRGFLGDANDDGAVNFADFVVLSNNYGHSDTGWSGADFNSDGATSFADFVILSNNYGQSAGGGTYMAAADELAVMNAFAETASPVPEPLTLPLLALGGAVLLTRGRR